MTSRTLATLLSIAIAAGPMRAGAQSRAPESARERMEALHAALKGGGGPLPESFFPAEGDWTWVHTTHRPSGAHVGVWRFRAADTEAAFLGCGPARRALLYNPERQPLGSLTTWALRHPGPWVLAGPNRFAPGGVWPDGPGGAAKPAAAFVEWRREGGRWVISAFGDESFRGWETPPVHPEVVRAAPHPAPAEPVYAEREDWYANNESLSFRGALFQQYGEPAAMTADEVEPIGWRGRVRVYAGAGAEATVNAGAGPLNVIYVPISPGVYRPYQRYTDGCP